MHKRRKQVPRGLKGEILKIGRRCAKLPNLDQRTPDQIIGYNEYGFLDSIDDQCKTENDPASHTKIYY